MNQKKCIIGKLLLSALLSLVMVIPMNAQSRTVSGKIVDKDGLPLPGVTIHEVGTSNAVYSDGEGAYTITLTVSDPSLEYTYMGFQTQTLKIGTKAVQDVTMDEDTFMLDQAVVVGYGTVRQKDLTTAVSVVETDDIETRPVTTVSGILQGKAAGVQVIQPSGQPGQGMVVRVRGASSIASSNDPLYVVDGVPVGEGNYGIEFLSPNDIETIQVLKDASSAAIYGSRSANGVVLITTKKGSKYEPKVTFNAFVGVSKVSHTYDVLNVAQYKELMDETGLVNLPDGLTDRTNWFDETYKTGLNQNYQLSVSGGNDKVTYYVGGGYSDEQGIIDVAYNKRYNFKATVEANVRKWLQINANVNYAHTSSNDIISGTGSNRAGVVLSVINTPTYAGVWDENNPDQYWSEFYGANLTTPSENTGRTKYNTNVSDHIIGTVGGTITFLPGFKLKSNFSMDRRWVKSSYFLDPIATSYGRTQHGEASATRSDDMRLIWDNILSYDYKSKDEKHAFSVMGGSSWTMSDWSQLYASRSYFSDQYDNAVIGLNGGNNGGLRGQSESASQWSIMSFMARATYDFKNKYLLTANFRADASSKLAPKHRWGFFPSVSAAWRISGEDWMSGASTWLDDLKIRAGWGQTGNQSGLDDYAYLQRYNTTYYDWTDPTYANSTPTVGDKSNIKNEDLTWETTTQTNVGIDMTVLNNRLTFTLDAYYKYTTNMLMTVPLPAPNPSIIRNEGEMSNKGIELGIQSRNFDRKNFKWDTDFNISFNKNKLEKLTFQQVYYYAVTSEALSEYVVRMTPGESLSKFWGYTSEGVDPETGDIMYKDLDGNGVINSSDKSYIGDANPMFTFGMTNSFSFYGFSISFLLSGSYGNDIYNASKIEMVGMYTGANQITDVLNRWKIPGQITDMPRANNVENLKASTRWIEDGSYIKLKNITLSYTFDSPKLKKAKISRIQPYITFENLYTLTNYSGYDPEVSQYSSATTMGIDWGTYPHVRTAIFGINIDF